MAHVVVDVDVLVLDPEGVVEVERQRHELAMQQRVQVQAARHVALVVLVEVAFTARRHLDQAHAAHVQWRLRGLEVEESCVLLGELREHDGSDPRLRPPGPLPNDRLSPARTVDMAQVAFAPALPGDAAPAAAARAGVVCLRR